MLSERNLTSSCKKRGGAVQENNEMEGRLRSETKTGTRHRLDRVDEENTGKKKKTEEPCQRGFGSASVCNTGAVAAVVAYIAKSSGTRQPWAYASTAPTNLRDEDGRSSRVRACTLARAFAVVVLNQRRVLRPSTHE